MRFADALDLLVEHKPIRRKAWPPGCYIQAASYNSAKPGEKLIVKQKLRSVVDQHGSPFIMARADFNADDWEEQYAAA